MKKHILSVIITGSLSCPVFASTSNNISNYFDSVGMNTAVTSPSSYKGQSASYYNGGSLTMKSSVSTIQPVKIQLPSISAGCGGIDFFAGGFSFINSEKLQKFAEDVASNSQGLIADLAIQTLTPQLHSVITKIQDWAQKLNNMNLNSCEVATMGLDSIKEWSGIATTNQKACEDYYVSSGRGNISDAKEKCASDANSVLDDMKKNDKDNPVLYDENIVWEQLLKFTELANDNELAELFMSITGTVIYTEDEMSTKDSKLLSDSDIIGALLYGGKYPVWDCSDTLLCLNPSESEKTLDAKDALVALTKEKLISIYQKVQNDLALENSDKSFLEITSIPVMRMFISSLEAGEILNSDLTNYSVIIASNIVQKYLTKILSTVNTAVNSRRGLPEADANKIRQAINLGYAKIENIPNDAYKKLNTRNELIKFRKNIDKKVRHEMNANIKNNIGK